MSVVSFVTSPEPDFWRITFSLELICLFVMIFAWLVRRLQEELPSRLRKRLRENGRLFRIGGEEFMLGLPKTRQKDADTSQVANAVRPQEATPPQDTDSLLAEAPD